MDQAAVIELLDRDGQVRHSHKIQVWPFRIGRAVDCDLVLDDPHVAGLHAELHWGETGPMLRPCQSLNGVLLEGKPLKRDESVAVPAGSTWQLGNTHLRLRTALDPLPDEQSLHAHLPDLSHWRRHLTPVLLVLWLFLLWFDHWASLNPGSTWMDYSTALLPIVGVLLLWAGLWALLTQLFQRRFPFGLHLRRSLLVVTGLHLWSLGLPLLAYTLSWPRLMALDPLSHVLGLTGLVWWQAQMVWPRAKRLLSILTLTLLTLGLGLMVANRQEQQYWFGPPYLSALPPPALRLATPKPPETLINELKTLEAELTRQANKDNNELVPEVTGD